MSTQFPLSLSLDFQLTFHSLPHAAGLQVKFGVTTLSHPRCPQDLGPSEALFRLIESSLLVPSPWRWYL